MARNRSEEDLIPYTGSFETAAGVVYVKGVMSEKPIGDVPPPEPPTDPEEPPVFDPHAYAAPVLHEDARDALTLNLEKPNHIITVAGDLTMPLPRSPTGQAGQIEFFNPQGHVVHFTQAWIALNGELTVGQGTTLIPYYVSTIGIIGSSYLTEDASPDVDVEDED